MKTLLEWLLQELIGEPPTVSRGNGESQWDCPCCGHPRFHTMPDRVGYRHRAKCWRCDFRGDAADMLRWFEPVADESYAELCDRLQTWKDRYETRMILYRGSGGTKTDLERAADVEQTYIELRQLAEDQPEHWKGISVGEKLLRFIVIANENVHEHGIIMDELCARVAREFFGKESRLTELEKWALSGEPLEALNTKIEVTK